VEFVVAKTDKVSCFKTIVGTMLLTLTNKTDLSIESAAFLCFHKFLVDGIGSTNYSGDSILILRGWAGKYGNGTNRYGVMCHMGSISTWWRHIKAVRAQAETWDIPGDQCHASNSGQQVVGIAELLKTCNWNWKNLYFQYNSSNRKLMLHMTNLLAHNKLQYVQSFFTCQQSLSYPKYSLPLMEF